MTAEILEPEVVGKELEKVAVQSGLPDTDVISLRGKFADCYESIVTLRTQAATIKNPEDRAQQKLASVVRKGLKAVRCDVERTRKALKDESLRRGRFIDSIAQILMKDMCEPEETRLEQIEKHAEIQEAKRIAAMIEERTRLLLSEGEDPVVYNLGQMTDETFATVLDTTKKARVEREEAARRAEAERIAKEQAEAAERERLRVENERLKKEAEEREAAAKAERERIEVERAKERELADAERKKAEASAKAAKEEAESKLRVEREAREKAEKEAEQTKRMAEERQKAEREEREKEERAPDKQKLIIMAGMIRKLPLMTMTTPMGNKILDEIAGMRNRMATWIEEQAGRM